ncbi:MAG: hypothetical protein ACLSDQ_09825 [Adlercreutzia equolifaciens]
MLARLFDGVFYFCSFVDNGCFHFLSRLAAQLAQGFGARGEHGRRLRRIGAFQLYLQHVLAFHGKHGCHVVGGEQRACLVGIGLGYARIGLPELRLKLSR